MRLASRTSDTGFVRVGVSSNSNVLGWLAFRTVTDEQLMRSLCNQHIVEYFIVGVIWLRYPLMAQLV